MTLFCFAKIISHTTHHLMDTHRWFHLSLYLLSHPSHLATSCYGVQRTCFCRNFAYFSFFFLFFFTTELSFYLLIHFSRISYIPSALFWVVTICQQTTNAGLKTVVSFNHKKNWRTKRKPSRLSGLSIKWNETFLLSNLTLRAADVCAACLHQHYMSYQESRICGFPHFYRSTFPTLAFQQ